jgi:L-iditol 2-dehydrogenase
MVGMDGEPESGLTVRLHGVGDLRAGTEPRPVPADGMSLVRVTAVGICGSDLHWFTHGGIGDAQLRRSVVPGHEFAGVVHGGPLDGRRVAVDPAVPCGRCPRCRDGFGNLCPTVAFCGHGELDGALRQWMTWPTELLHPLPDNLTEADGAMLEPLGVALHAFDLGHLRVGGAVAVVGCGPIGLLLVQLARVAGAGRVVAMDPLGHRTDAARRLGADETATAGAAGTLDGAEADVVFEVAGNDEAVHAAVTAARPGARVVLVGIPDEDSTTLPAGAARRKGLTFAMCRRMNHVYPRAIDLVRRGRVDVTSLVTHRFALPDATEAFRTAARRAGLKVLITP